MHALLSGQRRRGRFPATAPSHTADRISYGLYEVTAAENDFGPQAGEKLLFADNLAEESFAKAKLQYKRLSDVTAERSGCRGLRSSTLRGRGYEFDIPLLNGDHVTDDAGTGFVHTAPGHGREDFDIWMDNARCARSAWHRSSAIPFTVGRGRPLYQAMRPGFEGEQVITDKGDKGKANEAVIKALIETGMLFARGRLKHTYPHSWRSKKPVIFRNTPQWFVYMDRDIQWLRPCATPRSRRLMIRGLSLLPVKTACAA